MAAAAQCGAKVAGDRSDVGALAARDVERPCGCEPGDDALAAVVYLLHFVLPFVLLLFRNLKRSAGPLAMVAGLLVIGLAGVDEKAHIRGLSILGELLGDDNRRLALMAAVTPRELHELIRAFEQEMPVSN